MTSSITGKVVIDDTDSLIHYVGPWITANGQNYDTQRDFGVTFNNSLHGTTGVANFSFSLVALRFMYMGQSPLLTRLAFPIRPGGACQWHESAVWTRRK